MVVIGVLVVILSTTLLDGWASAIITVIAALVVVAGAIQAFRIRRASSN